MAQRINEIEIKTRQVNLSITGMTCSSCVGSIEKALNKIPGVRAAVNLAMESAHVIAPLNISEQDLISAVNSAGYKATSFKGERESFEKSTRLGIRLFVTLLFALPVLLISMIDELHKSIDEYLLNFIDYFNIQYIIFNV